VSNPKQYVYNKITELHRHPNWMLVKDVDKVIYYYLVPLLRVKETEVRLRGRSIQVQVGTYFTTTRSLSESLGIGRGVVRGAIQRLQKFEFLNFEPFIVHKQQWGTFVSRPINPRNFKIKCNKSSDIIDSCAEKSKNKKTLDKNQKKLTHGIEKLTHGISKNEPTESPHKKTHLSTSKKIKSPTELAKTNPQYTKSVLNLKKNISMMFNFLKSWGDNFYKFKELEITPDLYSEYFVELMELYQKHLPRKALAIDFETFLSENKTRFSLENLCLWRGWLEQRDSSNARTSCYWPKFELLIQKDQRQDHIQKGYEYFMKQKQKQELKKQKKRIELAERDRLHSEKEIEIINKQVMDYVECIGSEADNLRLTANSKAFAALGLHTKTELEIKAIKERKSYKSLYNQLLIQEVLYDKQHRKEFYSGDFKIVLFQKEKKKYEADIFCYEATK
jgi:hypothetical protein